MAQFEPTEVEPANRIKGSPKHRRRRILVIGVLVGCVLFGIALLCGGLVAKTLYDRSLGEVRAMQPWPSDAVDPADAIPSALIDLGFGTAVVSEARTTDSVWAEGSYSHGVVAEYTRSGEPALWIAALRFDSTDSLHQEFQGYVAWAEENCGARAWANLFGSGIIKCYSSDAHNTTFMQGNWIFDIVALGSSSTAAQQSVNQARDALVAHWQLME